MVAIEPTGPSLFFEPPRHRFTILLPARDLSTVTAAVNRLQALRYPPDMVEVLVAIEARDAAADTLAALSAAVGWEPDRVRLFTYERSLQDESGGINQWLRQASGDVVSIFDPSDAPHLDVLHVVNTIMVREAAPMVQCDLERAHLGSRGFPTASLIRRLYAMPTATPRDRRRVFVRRDLLAWVNGWDGAAGAGLPLPQSAGSRLRARLLAGAVAALALMGIGAGITAFVTGPGGGPSRALDAQGQERRRIAEQSIARLLNPIAAPTVPLAPWRLLSGATPEAVEILAVENATEADATEADGREGDAAGDHADSGVDEAVSVLATLDPPSPPLVSIRAPSPESVRASAAVALHGEAGGAPGRSTALPRTPAPPVADEPDAPPAPAAEPDPEPAPVLAPAPVPAPVPAPAVIPPATMQAPPPVAAAPAPQAAPAPAPAITVPGPLPAPAAVALGALSAPPSGQRGGQAAAAAPARGGGAAAANRPASAQHDEGNDHDKGKDKDKDKGKGKSKGNDRDDDD